MRHASRLLGVLALLVVAVTAPGVTGARAAPAAPAAEVSSVLTTGTADATGVLGAKWRSVPFSVPVAGPATLRLDWTGTGDLDMSLFDGTTRLGLAADASRPKVLSATLATGRTYDARVWAQTGSGTFTLTLTTPAPGDDTRVIASGTADSTGTLGAAWRKVPFTAPTAGTATLRLDWTGTGDLDLSVFATATGTRIALADGTARPKVVTFPVAAGGAYDARVWATAGSGIFTLTLTLPAGPRPPGDAPNILLINTDDQRADTLSALPAVQRWLAAQGTTFSGTYTSTPSCCPSRASLMTGRYVHNNGQYQQQTLGLDLTATTQVYLHDAGYLTGHVGKFLNWLPLADRAPGFDRWTHYRGGYQDVYMNVDGVVRKTAGYTTTIVFDTALSYLADFEAADDSRPWFLQLAPTAPHEPSTPEAKHATSAVPPYQTTPAYQEADRSDKPVWVRNRNWTPDKVLPLREAMIRSLYSVDDGLDRVMTRLAATGELANTLVVFTSDNGFLWGEHKLNEKFLPYWPSVAVPLVVRWDGHVAKGATDNRPVAQLDLAPTFLDVAGQDSRTTAMDGRSLFGGTRRTVAFTEYWQDDSNIAAIPSWASVRTADVHYTEYYSDAALTTILYREYYDLRTDPYELLNLLGDASTANDPSTTALHAQLTALKSCRTTTCP